MASHSSLKSALCSSEREAWYDTKENGIEFNLGVPKLLELATDIVLDAFVTDEEPPDELDFAGESFSFFDEESEEPLP